MPDRTSDQKIGALSLLDSELRDEILTTIAEAGYLKANSHFLRPST
jgi:hypothetical protein